MLLEFKSSSASRFTTSCTNHLQRGGREIKLTLRTGKQGHFWKNWRKRMNSPNFRHICRKKTRHFFDSNFRQAETWERLSAKFVLVLKQRATVKRGL
jgi:hypothetical protein